MAGITRVLAIGNLRCSTLFLLPRELEIRDRRGFVVNQTRFATKPFTAHTFLPNPEFVFDFGDHGPRVQADGVHAQKGYDNPWHSLNSHIMLTSRMFLIERRKSGSAYGTLLGMEAVLTHPNKPPRISSACSGRHPRRRDPGRHEKWPRRRHSTISLIWRRRALAQPIGKIPTPPPLL